MKWVIGLLIILGLSAASVHSYRHFMKQLVPTQFEPVHFKTLALPNRKNIFFVCPVSYCRAVSMIPSPIFSVTTQELLAIVQEIMSQMPRTMFIGRDNTELMYVSYSALWEFPDLINIRVISQSANLSSIAVYSRSLFGYYDFDINRTRVTHLLDRINTRIEK